MSVKILDCTFRDGGYYCDWDFDAKLTEQYVDSVNKSGIDIVEVGFRFLPQERFLGAWAYSTDEMIRKLGFDDRVMVGVMIDAKDFLRTEDPVAAIAANFTHSNDSRVSLVRIACHFKEVEAASTLATELKSLGYVVGLNIMQIDAQPYAEITRLASIIEKWGSVDVLYFADSLGSLDAPQVREIANALKAGWTGELGFHAHNNKGQALVNCGEAINAGVTWVDGTITGMGRGAGNVPTESLLLEVQSSYPGYDADALFKSVCEDFEPMKSVHRWGPSFMYHIAAVDGIHPTYIQEMMSDERYDSDQLLSSLHALRSVNARSFSSDKLQSTHYAESTGSGEWSAAGWADNKNVLIIAPGALGTRHVAHLADFIKKTNSKVLCLNANTTIPNDLVDMYVACNSARLAMEVGMYSALGKPLLAPLGALDSLTADQLSSIDVCDFGLTVQAGEFAVNGAGCVVSQPLALGYGLAFANAADAKNVYLWGADGYSKDDPRYTEMEQVLEQYKAASLKPIIAVTPTNYNVDHRSLFEPNLG